ncbi:MAG: ribonuclease HII [Patescibacteria group bacterium]
MIRDGNIKIIGIDEVGRGPLAGPVAVCAVFASRRSLLEMKREISFTDSKKMSSRNRESVWYLAKERKRRGDIDYSVSFISSEVIDRKGIVPAILKAIERSIKRTEACNDTPVLLDGGLRAPEQFLSQFTIKRGDQSEDAIALASVLAKVSRDRKMERFHKKYPGYGFFSNKGYGTKEHIEAIKRQGPCKIHRKTFIKNLI